MKPPVALKLVEPPAVARTAFTFKTPPPAGAVESFVNVSVAGPLLPAPSAAVTVSVGWLVVPSVQENAFES